MSGMVDDLLTLSRIDAHQELLAREPLDLAALARATVGRAGHGGGRRGRRAAADGGDAGPAVGDAGHVRRALRNVVRNAVEHSPRGAVVEVAVQRAAGGARVVVTDHGEGMPPEVLAHVFDRFYRADAARSRDRGGSGLGPRHRPLGGARDGRRPDRGERRRRRHTRDAHAAGRLSRRPVRRRASRPPVARQAGTASTPCSAIGKPREACTLPRPSTMKPW